jgi:hypothetical protein
VVPDLSGEPPTVDLSAEERSPLGVTIVDGAAELDGGFLLASDTASEQLGDALVAAGSLTVAAWISTDDTTQHGPTRIVTLSHGAGDRAFTIGHHYAALHVRFRCSETTSNGAIRGTGDPVHYVDGVFPTTGFVHVALVWDGAAGESRLYVDGAQRAVRELVDSAGAPATLDWETSEDRFGVGDEYGAARSWHGAIADLAIYDRALTETEVAELSARGL